MRDPRLEKLADVIVNYSVGVKPGQVVRISSPAVATPLVLEVYRSVVRATIRPATLLRRVAPALYTACGPHA